MFQYDGGDFFVHVRSNGGGSCGHCQKDGEAPMFTARDAPLFTLFVYFVYWQ